jgi:hypothetical protein
MLQLGFAMWHIVGRPSLTAKAFMRLLILRKLIRREFRR